MAFSNSMTKLLNKTERRLGLRVLEPHLAKIKLGKNDWVEAIKEDSLPTFSRFFPNTIRYEVTKETPHDDDGFYYIDEKAIEDCEIIGIQDLDFRSFSQDSIMHMQDIGYGFTNYQALQAGFTLEDIGNVQMAADVSSLFNQGIYVNFQPPNKFRLESSTNMNVSTQLQHYFLKILISHSPTLLTIPATMMEIFEKLVYADVANFLYQNLKYYDGLETIYATIELKLDDLQRWAETRDDIVQILDEAHVSASNDACPIMVTI